MFAIFTRLTRGEEVPRTERLRARARYGLRTRPASRGGTLQAIMVAPILMVLLLGVVTLCVFLAASNPAARGCKSVPRPRAAAIRPPGCESLPPTWK
jgi:hypothetical protein